MGRGSLPAPGQTPKFLLSHPGIWVGFKARVCEGEVQLGAECRQQGGEKAWAGLADREASREPGRGTAGNSMPPGNWGTGSQPLCLQEPAAGSAGSEPGLLSGHDPGVSSPDPGMPLPFLRIREPQGGQGSCTTPISSPQSRRCLWGCQAPSSCLMDNCPSFFYSILWLEARCGLEW